MTATQRLRNGAILSQATMSSSFVSKLGRAVERIDLSSADIRGQARREIERLGNEAVGSILEEALETEFRTEAHWQLCLEGWVRRSDSRQSDSGFVSDVIDWIDRAGDWVTHRRAIKLANRIAWDTAGEPERPTQAELVRTLDGSPSSYFIVTLYADRARFLARFKSLDRLLDALPREVQEWPLCQAYRGMEILGRGNNKPEQGRRAIRSAMQSLADGGIVPGVEDAVIDIATQALDMALNPDDFAEELLAIGSDIRHDNRTPVVLYRLARANGRRANTLRTADSLGASRHREIALDQLRDALSKLEGDNDFSRYFGDQIRQERDIQIVDAGMDRHFCELLTAQRELRETEARIKEEARSNAVRSTEVLALFSSAVAFAVGAAAVGSNATSPWASVAIGFALIGGLLGFSILLLLASRFATRSNLLSEDPVAIGSGQWVWRATVVISLLLSALALVSALLVAPKLNS